jgi:hypothetical protein
MPPRKPSYLAGLLKHQECKANGIHSSTSSKPIWMQCIGTLISKPSYQAGLLKHQEFEHLMSLLMGSLSPMQAGKQQEATQAALVSV